MHAPAVLGSVGIHKNIRGVYAAGHHPFSNFYGNGLIFRAADLELYTSMPFLLLGLA